MKQSLLLVGILSLPLAACDIPDASGAGSLSEQIAAACGVAVAAGEIVQLVGVFFPGAATLTASQASEVVQGFCERAEQTALTQRTGAGAPLEVVMADGTVISGVYLGSAP